MRSKLRRTIAAPIRAIGILQFILGVTGRLLTSHGTLYKALGRLADAGLLETEWEDPKKRRPRDGRGAASTASHRGGALR